MNATITLHEYRSPVWKYLMYINLTMAVVFCSAYLSTSSPFWMSIFRLIAFAGFAGSVLLYLKIREKPKVIKPEVTSNDLVIHYLSGEEEIKEELFALDTIKEIQRRRGPGNILREQTYRHTITFTDTDTELNVFTYSGQQILMTAHDADAFRNFLADYRISYREL